MLNKKKVVAVAVIALIIFVLIISLFVKLFSGKNRVELLYNDLQEIQTYLFTMKNNTDYEITVAKKEGQICIDLNNENDRSTTLVKDGITYLIVHALQEYYIYDNDITEGNIITEMLSGLINEDYSKGKEEIDGKKYKYQEYIGFSGFMTSTNTEIESENIRTRFYFDGDTLVYIKTIIDSEEELLAVNISYDVDDNLFELPSDYIQAN